MYRMSRPSHSAKSATLQALVKRLARPYQRRFLLIGLLALLGTAAELAQPLIYRVAINDVAGLFVELPAETSPLPESSATPSAIEHHLAADEIKRVQAGAGAVRQDPPAAPERLRGPPHAAADPANSALGGFPALPCQRDGLLRSRWRGHQSTLAAADIEAGLIQSTFGHVLRLPLSFFTRRAE